jgi:antitoxin component of MazEF toxin-antitoxin module
MKQKIIKVGNSAAITLPASFVREARLSIGSEVIVEPNMAYNVLFVKPKNSLYKTNITPEFKEWLDSFIKKNTSLLKKLAKT